MVSDSELEDSNTTFESALDQGLQNLRARSAAALEPLSPGLFASPWLDGHDAARLMLPDLMRRVPVRGEVIAMAPNRDVLLVTGSDDVSGLDAMVRVAAAALRQPNAIHGFAFKLVDDRLTPWLPDRRDPNFKQFATLRVQSLASSYGDVKDALDASLTSQEDVVFISEFETMFEPETQELSSFSTWVQGVPSLLPRTERVVLVGELPTGESEVAADVEWEQLERVVRPLMAKTDYYPEYVRVSGFPSEPQIRTLARG
jgi:hypothetical protein